MGEDNLDRVGAHDIDSVLAVVEAELERTGRQVASLEAVVADIVEGSELTSTDDEHDPAGATIAYERAQASARLRQARADDDALCRVCSLMGGIGCRIGRRRRTLVVRCVARVASYSRRSDFGGVPAEKSDGRE